MKSLGAETVAPACPRQWMTWCTSLRCSHMKCLIPAFSGIVLYPLFDVSYCDVGPLMAMLSTNDFATVGISGSRMKVTSPWKTATAFVAPWGSTVHLGAPRGV